MYKHLLIPTDGSALAEKAVDAGIDFARQAGAKVTFFTAVPERHPQAARETAKAVLSRAVEKARWAGVEVVAEYAENDRPAEAIVAAAQRCNCDAIFMSSHGRSGIDALLRGSATIAVIAHSDVPTVVHR